jgi:gas vesicle protein
MSPEYVAALFGLIGTVVGAIVGACASIFTTKSELAVSYNQMKMSVLRERIEGLQRALSQISSVKTNVPAGKLSDEEIIAPQLQAFRERAAIFLSNAHYYTREEEDSIRDVVQRLDMVTYNVKTGRSTTGDERIGIVRDVEACDSKITTLLKERLRQENYRVSKLIDNKKC